MSSSSASELLAIPARAVDEWLPLLRPAFQLMADQSGGRWQVGDVIEQIADGRQWLWVSINEGVIEAVLLTEFVQYPRRKAVRFSSCVGKNWKNWTKFHVQIAEWAKKHHGCDLAEMFGARKWRHAFPEYREYHVLMECDL